MEIPKIERKADVKASADTIFKIIDDDPNYAKWNIVINEVITLEPGKYHFKTNVGDVYSTRMETIPNKKIYATMEGSPISGFEYLLNPKGDLVEVTIGVEFEDPNQEAILGAAGDVFRDCVKNYSEFIEAGGNPEDYNKKKGK